METDDLSDDSFAHSYLHLPSTCTCSPLHMARVLAPPCVSLPRVLTPCPVQPREAAGRQCHLPAERFEVLADGRPLSAQISMEEADYFNRRHGLAIVSL